MSKLCQAEKVLTRLALSRNSTVVTEIASDLEEFSSQHPSLPQLSPLPIHLNTWSMEMPTL